ncbi:putative holin-like toxin [Alicyclobacillus fodiniaquatilis]|uniref:Holin-like toxin n=1 Tax=Alicyclobacillus fodiniaquatilis TaxID=1661150 RepID=A0ABW4JG97_9BACL
MYVTYQALGVAFQGGMFLLALLTLIVTIIVAFRSHK